MKDSIEVWAILSESKGVALWAFCLYVKALLISLPQKFLLSVAEVGGIYSFFFIKSVCLVLLEVSFLK